MQHSKRSLTQLLRLLRSSHASLSQSNATVPQIYPYYAQTQQLENTLALQTTRLFPTLSPGSIPTPTRWTQSSTRRSIHCSSIIPSTTNQNHSPDESQHEDVLEELADVFTNLISTAYGLLADGKPEEAENLLRKGAEQAEEALGAGSVQVAPLWDQLAMFLFMFNKSDEAQGPARRAWEAVDRFASEEGSLQAKGAAATAAVRYASTVVGAGNAEAAQPMLHKALHDLDDVIAELEESNAKGEDIEGLEKLEKEQYLEKFSTARGEALLYFTLCQLASSLKTSNSGSAPEIVESFSEELQSGLRQMTAHLGPRHPLTACALREHNKLTEHAVDAEQGPLAETLYGQEIMLHQAFDPEGEHIAALYYQLGTLQYCNGRAASAIHSLQKAISVLENNFENVSEHLVGVKHRLAMALGVVGRYDHARDIFNSISPGVMDNLGPGNPISTEIDFMMAFMNLKQENTNKDSDEYNDVKDVLIKKMEDCVLSLKQFGEQHMLVRYANQLLQDAKA